MLLALKWKRAAEKLHCLFPYMGHENPDLVGQKEKKFKTMLMYCIYQNVRQEFFPT
jgi:hypothetical protein